MVGPDPEKNCADPGGCKYVLKSHIFFYFLFSNISHRYQNQREKNFLSQKSVRRTYKTNLLYLIVWSDLYLSAVLEERLIVGVKDQGVEERVLSFNVGKQRLRLNTIKIKTRGRKTNPRLWCRKTKTTPQYNTNKNQVQKNKSSALIYENKDSA